VVGIFVMLVERHAKRETLSWNDFSSAGFTCSNAPLSTTLQFSPPLTLHVCFSNLEHLAQSALTNQLEELKVAQVWRQWFLGAIQVISEKSD
jgi:hypothetical protein